MTRFLFALIALVFTASVFTGCRGEGEVEVDDAAQVPPALAR